MHELYLLKAVVEEVLLPANYVLVAEDTTPDHYGGYISEYSRGAHRIRFIWDGRGGCGYLEHCVGSGGWQRIGIDIGEDNREAMREAAAAEWPQALAAVIEGREPA